MLDLVKRVREHRVSSYRKEPGLSNRASELGHPCLRYLVYSRTAWDKAKPPNDESISIFAEGDIHEAALLCELVAAGVDVVEQQAPLYHRELNITGHVDGVIHSGDKVIVLEIKSMNPYIFKSCFPDGGGTYEWDAVEGAFENRPWLRRYYPQVQMYMELRGAEGVVPRLCALHPLVILPHVVVTRWVDRDTRRPCDARVHRLLRFTCPPRADRCVGSDVLSEVFPFPWDRHADEHVAVPFAGVYHLHHVETCVDLGHCVCVFHETLPNRVPVLIHVMLLLPTTAAPAAPPAPPPRFVAAPPLAPLAPH